MPRFRKKPVVIEAVQWDGVTPHGAVDRREGELVYSRSEAHYYVWHPSLNASAWMPMSGKDEDILPFAFYEVKSGRRVPFSELAGADLELVQTSLQNYQPTPKLEDLKPWGYIETLEGKMEVNVGDWIIKGVKGEFYPCKDDIFRATYEPVE